MESINPLVSVVIPCYNYGKFLSDALDSLILQSYTNWECIIVNDGSTDETENIALKYVELDSRIRYIYQKNGGLHSARNTALKETKGEYIQLLDADDLLQSEKFLLQVNLFKERKDIDFIYSDMVIFYSETEEKNLKPFSITSNPSTPSGKNEVIVNTLIKDVFFLPGCPLFRTEVFKTVGFFAAGMPGLEDWNYWYRIALSGYEFFHDDREGTKLIVRDHDANMSKVYFKMLNARIKARENIMDICISLKNTKRLQLSQSFYKRMMKEHKTSLYRESYEYNFHHGNKKIAILSLFKYGYFAKKPFFPFIKILSSIRSRLNK